MPTRGRSRLDIQDTWGTGSLLGSGSGEQGCLGCADRRRTDRRGGRGEFPPGLAPVIRAEIWACLARLKQDGQSILVIDKNVDALVKLADRHLILEKGRIVWEGTSGDFLASPDLKDRYLHV